MASCPQNTLQNKSAIVINAELPFAVLDCLQPGGNVGVQLQALVEHIRETCELDAVGLRLLRGDDYPYFAHIGLPENFLLQEDRLFCPALQNGEGETILACVCGAVLHDSLAEGVSFRCEGGGFLSNSLSALLADEAADDLPMSSRETCPRQGFESMLILPVCCGESRVGVLQLCDQVADRFSTEVVHFFRQLANGVGLAWQKMDQGGQAVPAPSRHSASLKKSRLSASAIKSRVDEPFRQPPQAVLNQLMEGNQLYRAVFQSPRIGLMVRDMHDNLLVVNPAFCRLLGYTDGELVGQALEKFAFEPDLQAAQKRMRKVVERESSQLVQEVRFVCQDGTLVWVRLFSVLLKDGYGQPQMWISKVQNINKEKLTLAASKESERQLRQKTEELRMSQELAALGGWEYERGSLILSPEACRQRGLEASSQDLDLDASLGAAHPDDVPKILGKLVEVASGANYRDYLYRSHPDFGDLRHFRSMVSRLEGASPEDYKIIGVTQDVTEFVRAQHQILESQKQFRSAFDQAPHGMALVAADGTFLEVNKALCDLFGYTETELLGLHFADITFEEDRDMGLEALQEMLAGKTEQCRFEKRYVTKDGRILWCDLSSSVVRDEAGQVHHMISQIYSIQTQKEAEEALRKNEEWYRSIFHCAQAAALLIDPDSGQIVDANSAASDFYGYTREQLNQLYIWDLNILPQNRVRLDMKRAMGPGPSPFQFRHCLASGEVRDVEVRSGPVDVGGRSLLYSIIFDATKRKAAERALRERTMEYRQLSQEFETLLNGISDPLYLITPEYDVVWANKSARQFWGIEELKPGQKCHHLWSGYDTPCPYCLCPQIFEQGEPMERILPPHDTGLWHWYGFPICDEAGTVRNIIVQARDVTEEQQLREEASRSQQLAALGELAAGVAHEINNPTGLIMLNIQRLIEMTPDMLQRLDRQFEAEGDFDLGSLRYSRMRKLWPGLQRDISKSAQRISQILGEMKDLTRVDEEITRQPVDLNEVALSALNLVEGQLLGATLNLKVSLTPDLPSVAGVFLKLEQVVGNILVNAAQSLAHYEKAIYVTSGVNQAGRPWVSVRDEGVGMEPAVLKQVKRPFFTTRRETGGTGLGLAICDRIIREHKGLLSIESRPGEGTSVTLLLPPLSTEIS